MTNESRNMTLLNTTQNTEEAVSHVYASDPDTGELADPLNNNNNYITNNNNNQPVILAVANGENNVVSLEDQIATIDENEELAAAALILGARSTNSSQGSDYWEGEDPELSESVRFPSQGSGFYCPASPRYSPSIPCMSQSSQDSLVSTSPNPIETMENQFLFFENSEITLAASNSESCGSQPEAKRMRLDE